jgi:hypothetical protein
MPTLKAEVLVAAANVGVAASANTLALSAGFEANPKRAEQGNRRHRAVGLVDHP